MQAPLSLLRARLRLGGMGRACWAFPTVLLTLSGCAVQTPPVTSASSWSVVSSLSAGTHVRVSCFDTSLANLPEHRVEGPLVDADDTAITVRTGAGPRRLLRSEVHRVDAARPKVRSDSLANGTLIGGLIGAAAVAFMAMGSAESSDLMPFSVPLLIVGGGLAIGALIDSAREGLEYQTICIWQPRVGAVLDAASLSARRGERPNLSVRRVEHTGRARHRGTRCHGPCKLGRAEDGRPLHLASRVCRAEGQTHLASSR